MTERSLHTGQMIRRDAQTPEETKALPFTDTQALQAASPPSHTRSLVPVSALCPAPGFSPRVRTPNCSFQHLPDMALTMNSVTRILLIVLLVPHSLTRLPEHLFCAWLYRALALLCQAGSEREFPHGLARPDPVPLPSSLETQLPQWLLSVIIPGTPNPHQPAVYLFLTCTPVLTQLPGPPCVRSWTPLSKIFLGFPKSLSS